MGGALVKKSRGSRISLKEYASFRSGVYRKRKLSDATLERVLQDPYVSQAFSRFMHGEFGELKLLFWLDVDAYQLIPNTELETKQKKAALIYGKYIYNQLDANDLYIDKATVVAIGQHLMIKEDTRKSNAEMGDCSKSFIVQQKDFEILANVYNLAANKIFQELKFEYMGKFIISDYFKDLRGDQGYFKDVDDAAEKAAALLEDMRIGYIVTHPLGLHYFLKFIYDYEEAGEAGQDLVDLIIEITDFRQSNADHRSRRFRTILKRYAHLESIPSILKLKEDFDAKPGRFKDCNSDVFDPTYVQCVTKLEQFVPDFKETSHFKKFVSSINCMHYQLSNSRMVPKGEKLDLSKRKVSANNSRLRLTSQTVEQITNFGEERHVSTRLEIEDMKAMLDNSLGLIYMKRFAIANFMEENILFYIEVQNFVEERILKPTHGTILYPKEDEDSKALQLRRARRIVSKYIEKDAPLQVNLSTKLREDTIALVESDCTKHVFDAAQTEILKLLQENLFNKFKTTQTYMMLMDKLNEKALLRANTLQNVNKRDSHASNR